MLVLPRDGDATLVVPALEALRVVERPDVFAIRPWGETDDPWPSSPTSWARRARWASAITPGPGSCSTCRWPCRPPVLEGEAVTGPLRAVKEPAEVEALRRAAAAVDRIAADLQAGKIPLAGRTEAEVSADLGRRIVDEGHQHVNFAIVAAGENAASPHHEAGGRVIRPGEVVLCDFGGTMLDDEGVGWCSDITRCVHVGEPPAEVAEAYAVLHEAQRAAAAAAVVGTSCEEVDAAARDVIADAGYGDRFIHRTGHGIGVEEHEDPYIVSGNGTPLAPGHAFSIEPGIYVPGRFGLRLEDIVVAAADGPDELNRADHALAVVEG